VDRSGEFSMLIAYSGYVEGSSKLKLIVRPAAGAKVTEQEGVSVP
jgi:hypothetical protein